jgi:hypothetical protein
MSISGAQEFMKQAGMKTKKALGLDETTADNQTAAMRRVLGLSPDWRSEYATALTNDINKNKGANFFSKSR